MALPASSTGDRAAHRPGSPGGTALLPRQLPRLASSLPSPNRETSLPTPYPRPPADPQAWDGPACLWVGRGSGRLSPAVPRPSSTSLAAQSPRWAVSLLWNRLRFNGFSPLSGQRRSRWRPHRPRRGKPEGTKGAGSRSV